MNGVAFFSAIVMGVSLIAVHIAIRGRRKWARLRSARLALDENALLSTYRAYENGTHVAKEVQDIICDEFLKSRIPILPSDLIEDTLNIAAEDFVELMERTLRRFGLTVDEALQARYQPPVRTVDDLIRLILKATQKRGSPSPRARHDVSLIGADSRTSSPERSSAPSD